MHVAHPTTDFATDQSVDNCLEITPLMGGAVISPSATVLLMGCFLLLIVGPLVLEVWIRPPPGIWSLFKDDKSKFGLQMALQKVETHLVENAEFSRTVRLPYQALLTKGLHEGSEQVVVGEDGYLFMRDDVNFSIGPGILSHEFLKEVRTDP